MNINFNLILALAILITASAGAAPNLREVLPAKAAGNRVGEDVMQQIFNEVKTPFKHGVVLRGEANELVDCPSIFQHSGRWYMVYVAIKADVGYQTFLARSDNLLTWHKLGKILSFGGSEWDRWQADGGVALVNPIWGGGSPIETFEKKYWMSFLGGALKGYEPDPLAIGMAWTIDPTQPVEWNRIAQNPVLTPSQPDTRGFEKMTLYKSTIIRDDSASLGYPFVMFYNGKIKGGFEKIGMAVSRDMVQWIRYGHDPVISNGDDRQNGISGDPQIVKIGEVWVMFYFGAFWKPKAFDTFACSYDLVHWTQWNGPHLVESSEPYDATYAHKPWVLKHNGVVYHYYCAVGDQGRVIALATSKDLTKTPPPK